LSVYGNVFDLWPFLRCRYPSRRQEAVGLDRPWCLAACIGVRPEMVVEVSFVEWTPDGLLRHVVYLGEREDKPAIDVRRDRPVDSERK